MSNKILILSLLLIFICSSVMVFAAALPQTNCSPYDYECIKERGTQSAVEEQKKFEEQQKRIDDLQKQRQEVIRQSPIQQRTQRPSNPYRQ